MRKMPRAVVAEASERLASTLSALAAEGLAVQESGKRFAAPVGFLYELEPSLLSLSTVIALTVDNSVRSG
jgi:hypothetical protein